VEGAPTNRRGKTDISTPDAGATIFVVTVMDVRYKPPREDVRE
jgi:hypothetical protein